MLLTGRNPSTPGLNCIPYKVYSLQSITTAKEIYIQARHCLA